ncbi:MAG TPA: hypothetical protein VK254_04105 [Candidatus Bathyarchaeia archaeon]|nr:hypothetical protein [Candidatus Bathyarchaeia archaeon]
MNNFESEEESELDEARKFEENVLGDYYTTADAYKKLQVMSPEQLDNLQKNLEIKRAKLSAELVQIENTLRSVSEAMFEKDKKSN